MVLCKMLFLEGYICRYCQIYHRMHKSLFMLFTCVVKEGNCLICNLFCSHAKLKLQKSSLTFLFFIVRAVISVSILFPKTFRKKRVGVQLFDPIFVTTSNIFAFCLRACSHGEKLSRLARKHFD